MLATPFEITWASKGRKAVCAPNPNYPYGMDVDVCSGQQGCTATLQYPAPECGAWIITCNICGHRAAITAAGRPDDPRTVKIPCKMSGAAQ